MILSSVRLLPDERLYLHNLRGDVTAVRRVIRRQPGSNGKLAVAGLSTDPEWLEATVRRIDEPLAPSTDLPDGGRVGDWLLEVRLGDDPAWGLTRAELAFDTGLDPQRRATFQVQVNLRPPVNLSSKQIALEGDAEQMLLMSVRSGVPADDLTIDSEPEALQVRVEPFGVRRYKLHVSWPEASGTRESNGSVTIRIGDAPYVVPVTRSEGGG